MAALADLLEAEGGESAVVFRQLDARLQLQGLEASCPRTRLSQREHAPSEAPALQARPHRDLAEVEGVAARRGDETAGKRAVDVDRKSVVWGKSVSVRVDLGGRPNIKQKKKKVLRS